jgi:hypothetical protein
MMVTTASARHLLLRLEQARLPDALLDALRDEVVLAGWLRGSGVVDGVRLRALGSDGVRSLAGPLQLVVLDGSVGLVGGDVTCGLRAVLTRETDNGIETIAGEIVEARAVALEVMVTAFDDVSATRRAANGVLLLDPAAAAASSAAASSRAAAPVAAPSAPVLPPSAPAVVPAPITATPPVVAARPSPSFSPAAMPARPVKPVVEEEEQVYPDAGDVVEHFAFGRCDVVKSDGDRLHLRLGKDGRIKEIALEMLRVTPLPPVEGSTGRHFKLDRKL